MISIKYTKSVFTILELKQIFLFPLILFFLFACDRESVNTKPKNENKTFANQQAVTSSAGSEGEKIFQAKCGTCHTVDLSKASLVGPHLANLFGRPAGSLEGFAYSGAIKTYAQNWTVENLNSFLENPAMLIPGNRMAFAGLTKVEQRQLIIEYLTLFE
jgi:cytochrome c